MPHKWQTGFVKGLRAKGGITADIKWENEKMTMLLLRSTRNVCINLVYDEKDISLQLNPDENARFNSELTITG